MTLYEDRTSGCCRLPRSLGSRSRCIAPAVDLVRALAEELECGEEVRLRERREGVVAFLSEGILAHAAVEEATACPAAEALLRPLGGTTATMALEHALIRALVAELENQAAADRYDAPAHAH